MRPLFRKIYKEKNWKFSYRFLKPEEFFDCESLNKYEMMKNKLKNDGYKNVGFFYGDFGIVAHFMFIKDRRMICLSREFGE